MYLLKTRMMLSQPLFMSKNWPNNGRERIKYLKKDSGRNSTRIVELGGMLLEL
jgi:hypothetical protein